MYVFVGKQKMSTIVASLMLLLIGIASVAVAGGNAH